MNLTFRPSNKFAIWLLQFLGLLGLLALCLWLLLRPKEPSYTIVGIFVPTQLSGGGSRAATLRFVMDIENKNKDSIIYYDDILLTFSYLRETLGNGTISSFHQEKDNTVEKAEFADANVTVLGAFVEQMKKTAQLEVDLVTNIKYYTWGVKSKHHQMHLQGTIPIGEDGKIAGKKKKVQLHHPSKK